MLNKQDQVQPFPISEIMRKFICLLFVFTLLLLSYVLCYLRPCCFISFLSKVYWICSWLLLYFLFSSLVLSHALLSLCRYAFAAAWYFFLVFSQIIQYCAAVLPFYFLRFIAALSCCCIWLMFPLWFCWSLLFVYVVSCLGLLESAVCLRSFLSRFAGVGCL
jgi:hypothetical protein